MKSLTASALKAAAEAGATATALADQAVEAETQPTEVRPPAAAALPMESVVEAAPSTPAETTPVSVMASIPKAY